MFVTVMVTLGSAAPLVSHAGADDRAVDRLGVRGGRADDSGKKQHGACSTACQELAGVSPAFGHHVLRELPDATNQVA